MGKGGDASDVRPRSSAKGLRRSPSMMERLASLEVKLEARQKLQVGAYAGWGCASGKMQANPAGWCAAGT
jgi:hypothetical protein